MTLFIWGMASLRRNDRHLLTASRVLGKLRASQEHAAVKFRIYGDSIYPPMDLLTSRNNAPEGHPEKARLDDVDGSMSSVRECIEWDYGEDDQFFPFTCFKERLKCDSKMPLM